MTVDVRTADGTQPIVALVPIFANFGHHHIPVLDASQRLVGMITQLDLISGLYSQAHAPQRLIAGMPSDSTIPFHPRDGNEPSIRKE
jgi:CBS domain-containing membrane protein